MQIANTNQANFGQLIIQRDKDLKTLTPEQTEVIFFLQENTDRFKSELLGDMEDVKFSDIIAKAKKNGNIDLYVRKELPSLDKNGIANSYIPYDAQNKFMMKTSVNLTKKTFPAAKKQIMKFLDKCRKYVVNKLAPKNKKIEETALDVINKEFMQFLLEQGIQVVLTPKTKPQDVNE